MSTDPAVNDKPDVSGVLSNIASRNAFVRLGFATLFVTYLSTIEIPMSDITGDWRDYFEHQTISHTVHSTTQDIHNSISKLRRGKSREDLKSRIDALNKTMHDRQAQLRKKLQDNSDFTLLGLICAYRFLSNRFVAPGCRLSCAIHGAKLAGGASRKSKPRRTR